MSVVDHKRSQPLLEQVRILPPREVELGIQGGRFDPVVAVADSLNGDLAEDRQVGTLAGSVQAGKFLVLVRARTTSYGQGRTQGLRTTFLRDFRYLSQYTQQILVFPPRQEAAAVDALPFTVLLGLEQTQCHLSEPRQVLRTVASPVALLVFSETYVQYPV